MDLNHFIGKEQLATMISYCRGEEGDYYKAMILRLECEISNMPKTYDTDDMGDDAPVTLHYFSGASDWYIIEKDAGSPDDDTPGIQAQAFGYAILNGDYENAELGYISIEELISFGVELDLYYKPETLRAIKDRTVNNK